MDTTCPDRFSPSFSRPLPPFHTGPSGSRGGPRRTRWLLLGAAGATALVLALSLSTPLRAGDELPVIRHQAEEGNASGEMMLGLMYDEGRGVPRDEAEARQWLERAAQDGNAYAADQLGRLYAEGRGGESDPAAAVHWWREAAKGGVADAQRRLGIAYFEGKGVVQNDTAAIHWLGAAAAQGDSAAHERLAQMVRDGRADPAVLDAHTSSFDRFAGESHSRIMRFFAAIGDLFTGGQPELMPDGADLTRRAEQGDVEAQYQLAWRYRTGAWSETQDDAKALHWFHEAADNGSRLAMQSLSEIYAQGLLGTRADPAAADLWQQRASSSR